MATKVCLECGVEYPTGLGTREHYVAHQHGKNNTNYGKTHTVKAREGMSKNHANVSGENNPFYGRTHSKKTKRRIGKSSIGRKHSKAFRRKISRVNRRRWKNGEFEGVIFNNRFRAGYRKDLKCFFRSTWEANFARVLNYLGERWKFEKRVFDCGKLGTYTPDFYLPDKRVYVEIKGAELNNKQKKKRRYCRQKYGVRIVVIKGEAYMDMQRKYRPLIKKWEA